MSTLHAQLRYDEEVVVGDHDVVGWLRKFSIFSPEARAVGRPKQAAIEVLFHLCGGGVHHTNPAFV